MSAEAAAARIMAAQRMRQEAATAHAAADRVASGWIVVGATALAGMLVGALMGAARGHAIAGALMLGLAGALLDIIRGRLL